MDLAFAYRQSDSRTPLLVMYTDEASMVEKLITDAANRKQVRRLPSELVSSILGPARMVCGETGKLWMMMMMMTIPFLIQCDPRERRWLDLPHRITFTYSRLLARA